MGRRSEQTFFQKRHTDGQQAHEMMHNIAYYQRNANQSHNEVLPHPFRMALIKKSTSNKYWGVCREKGTVVHCCWKCKLMKPVGKRVLKFLKKGKKELPCDPSITLFCIYVEKMKTLIQEDM